MASAHETVQLASDAILLALDSLRADFGDGAAHGLIYGVYSDRMGEISAESARRAARVAGSSRTAQSVAGAVGERTTEFVAEAMSGLLLGAVTFAGQAVADLEAATGRPAAELASAILERLSHG